MILGTVQSIEDEYGEFLDAFEAVSVAILTVIALFLVVMLVLSSASMYFVENEAQPGAFASIPAAMWWGVSTLTTVGYGDVYPITPFGKFLGSIIALIGIGFFALPAGVLSSAFAEQLHRRREAGRKACPHCGREIE